MGTGLQSGEGIRGRERNARSMMTGDGMTQYVPSHGLSVTELRAPCRSYCQVQISISDHPVTVTLLRQIPLEPHESRLA